MSDQRPTRVGLLTNIPTPYRLPLFQRLSERPGIALSVAFCAASEHNRRWQLASPFTFDHVILPGRTVALTGADLVALHINGGLATWADSRRLDALIVGGWSSLTYLWAAVYCRRRGIPMVLWSGSTAGESGIGRRLSLPIVRLMVRAAKAYVAYGTAAARYLEGLGAPPERIARAVNTVDLDHWTQASARADRAALRQELALGERVTFLYVGQLIRRKGVDLLLEAFAQARREYPKIALVIAGEGQLEEELRALARRLGLDDVRFVGHRGYGELPGYYAAADVVVLPSRSEVWGLTVNEALAAARPVICSETIGAAHDLVIGRPTGWVARAGSVTELAARLREAAALPEGELGRMGQEARAFALRHCSIEASVDGFVDGIRRGGEA